MVAANDEERPFSRDERTWIYASAKGERDTIGFGTDNDIGGQPGYLVLKHAAFPFTSPSAVGTDELVSVPCAKTLGESHGRAKPWQLSSIVNVSGMSFGALSGRAIESLNRGAFQSGAY